MQLPSSRRRCGRILLPTMRTKLLSLAVCLAVAGCGGREGNSPGAATGGTMAISVPADAATIFPPHVFDQVGRAVQDQLFDRLADISDDLNTIGDKGFKPRLADRWEWSRDSLSVAFHISRLARWDAGQRLEIVADTANSRGRPKLDRVVWSMVPDAGAALAQLLNGQADFLEFVPPDQLHLVDSSKADRTLPYPSLQYAFLGFNLVDPKDSARPHSIFGDRQVRRALSMALDRKAMLQNVYGTFGRVSYGPFPRSLSYADTTLHLLPYDVNAAKVLLDSAGWREPSPGAVRQKNGRPLRFSLTLPLSSRPRVAFGVLIQEQLRRIGAQVDLDQVQGNVFFERMSKRAFDAVLQA